jgi:hypothetical protein
MKSTMAFRNSGFRAVRTAGVGIVCALLAWAAEGCGGSSYHVSPTPPSVCSGIDLQPASTTLDEQSILDFLKAQNIPTRVSRERSDLVYVETQLNGKTTRLRVAILPSSIVAGRELHDAIRQHGKGAWGVHRGNLAVLGPIDSVDSITAYADQTKLACWGVLTIGASEEAYVVPGGYREL